MNHQEFIRSSPTLPREFDEIHDGHEMNSGTDSNIFSTNPSKFGAGAIKNAKYNTSAHHSKMAITPPHPLDDRESTGSVLDRSKIKTQ